MSNEEGRQRIVATLMSRIGTWQDVRDAARNTVDKRELGPDVDVSSSFKRRILLAEHSPIRCLQFRIRLENLPYWVSVHLVRHKIGVEHFVTTQRDDRDVSGKVRMDAGIDVLMDLIRSYTRRLVGDGPVSRKYKMQGELVTHEMLINAQSLIQLGRKRLCYLASPETTASVALVRAMLHDEGEPELASVMVPECIYRGFCPETEICKPKFVQVPKFQRDLERYRERR